MITTVTLNASIDKLYLVNGLEPSRVMRVSEVHNTAGGKGLNVAKVSALAGEAARAMGFVGGFNGGYLRSLLASRGIEDALTECAGETRSCINIRDVATGKHTEFLEPGMPVTEQEVNAFTAAFEASLTDSDVVTISGSVPKGTPPGLYNRLIREAKGAGVPVILDTSGELLLDGANALPTMIKPNAKEIAQLLGRPLFGLDELITAARQLHIEGIKYVVVSMGASGALMACEAGIFQGLTPDIPVINTVGCGDSMVAGFAIGLRRGYAPVELLAYATAVSTANALSILTGDIDPACVLHILQKVKSVQIA